MKNEIDTITQWREDRSSASVVNHAIATDPIPAARFQSPSSYIVSDEPFLDRSALMSC